MPLAKKLFRIVTVLGNDITYVLLFFVLWYILGTGLAVKFIIADLITLAILFSVRAVYFKPRPQPKPYKAWWQKLDASSFPSAHAARSTLLAYFLSISFTPLLIPLWTVIAAVICYSRIYLKKHDWNDIAGGIILGLIIALLVF